MNGNNLIMENKRHSQVLDLLRFPLAVVIVIVHVFMGQSVIFVQGTEYSFAGMTIFSFFMKFVDAFLRNQSVPIYFFISGYVFFLSVKESYPKDMYVMKLKNRLKTLLVPYILWNIIATLVCFSYYFPPLSSFFPNLNVSDIDTSWKAILNIFWDTTVAIFGDAERGFVWNASPQDAPLWFVRDLMFLSLLSPVIYFLIKKLGVYIVLLFGLFWFYGVSSDALTGIGLGTISRVFIGLFFFSLGAYLSIHKLDMVHQFGKYSKLSFLLYPLLGTIYIVLSYMSVPALVLSIIKAMNVFVGLFFAYNLAAIILEKGILRTSPFLTSSSFFVYVTHWIIMRNVVRLFFVLLKPTSDLGVLGTYLLATLMIIALILIVYWLMKRFTPRLLGVLVGRRA